MLCDIIRVLEAHASIHSVKKLTRILDIRSERKQRNQADEKRIQKATRRR
jgi:hypothetical protein